MTLPATPPWFGPVGSNQAWVGMTAPIERGDSGWRAYAVQRAVGVAADGDFGPQTELAVQKFQRDHALSPDGVVGPRTQLAMLRVVGSAVHATIPALPDGLLAGFADTEGAGLLAPVNWYTPPGGRAGCDCGPVQLRQYGPPFEIDGLRDAFDAKAAFTGASQTLLARIADYRRRRPSLTARRALELAVLAHNAPFLAEQFVRNGRLTTPDALAVWTRKPDGTHYTHAEWAIEYVRRMLHFVES